MLHKLLIAGMFLYSINPPHAHANDLEDMMVEQETQSFYAEQRAEARHAEVMDAIQRQGMNCSVSADPRAFVPCGR